MSQHHVNESADKIQVKTKLVRGGGPRDKETIVVRVKGDTPEQVCQQLDVMIEKLESQVKTIRGIQP